MSPEVTVKNLQKCYISSTLDGTVDHVFGMAVKRLGMLAVSVRKMKTVALVMDIWTNNEDGVVDTDWLKQTDCYFLCPDSYKIILDFPLGAVFYLGGRGGGAEVNLAFW